MSEGRRFIVACADARAEGSYQILNGQPADLLLTDPPYCLLTRRRKGGDPREKHHRKIEREPVARFDTVADYRAFTEQWLTVVAKTLSSAAPMIVWTNFLGRESILSVAGKLGYRFLGEFVWAKRTTERQGNEYLLRVYEIALVLGTHAAAPLRLSDPSPCWAVVASYDEDGEAARWGNHPNHKPFTVVEPLIRAYSGPGQLVLDPFAGSGSIAAAALRLGRRAATMEIEPLWAQRVERRLETTSTANPE